MTSETSDRESTTCAEVVASLEDYVAGDLTAVEESRVAAHLMACPRCAGEVALGERVVCELAALPAFDAPPELIARIKAATVGTTDDAGREAFRRQAPERAAPAVANFPRRRRILLPLGLAASLLAALAVGWWQSAQSAGPGADVALAAQPTAAEVAAAEKQARYALALVARLGRRAGTEIRQEVLIERIAVPLVQGVGGPLQRAAMKSGGLES